MQFSYKTTSLLNENDIIHTVEQLLPYVQHLQQVVKKQNYEDAESSINLPSDQQILEEVTILQNHFANTNIEYIVDIGIGGSNLGTKAVYDALYGYFDVLQPDRKPKMIFADTNDPEFLYKLKTFVTTQKNILINAISKSGGTTETIANLEIILNVIHDDQFVRERLVITTDHGSKFWHMAQEKGIKTLTLPKQVGGRYSVLSAVGLFPLAMAGININQLRKGAADIRAQCLSTKIEDNSALLSAVILFLHNKQGKNINDNFCFEPEMESIGKWYRQLMGESIGKEDSVKGEKIYAGITPTVSIGSTDLHSMGQLYLGGPKDKITTFVSVEHHREDVTLPRELQFPLVEHINEKKASDIMTAILEGVQAAYTKQNCPYMDIKLKDVSEYSIGAFFQFKMIEMMYLGKLLEVNPFDQPHVELYKVETKRILNKV
jgi:glucose-6-phosphate isomerase